MRPCWPGRSGRQAPISGVGAGVSGLGHLRRRVARGGRADDHVTANAPRRKRAIDDRQNDPPPRGELRPLGCRRRWSTERIITRLRAEGYELARGYAGADLAIVNTCGFLDSAQAESLAASASAAQNGRDRHRLHGSRAGKDHRALPGARGHRAAAIRVVGGALRAAARHDPFLDLVPPEGIKLTPRHYAHLKTSEAATRPYVLHHPEAARAPARGQPPTYCARPMLVAPRKELLVISQDTSAHGVDVKYAGDWRGRAVPATDLTRAGGSGSGCGCTMSILPARRRGHPADGAGQGVAQPRRTFQHASPEVLRRMKRPAAQERRSHASAIGATSAPNSLSARPSSSASPARPTRISDAARLARCGRARSVGCFRYEPVKGAVANDLAAAVPAEVKEARWHQFMQRQQAISARRLKRKVGTRQRVIIDAVGPTVAKGRSRGDAPEIDGAVHVASHRPLRVGEIATVKIERADDYDRTGRQSDS